MRVLLAASLALATAACDTTSDPGPVIGEIVLDVRAPRGGAPVPDDLRVALVWSTGAGALGAPAFIATDSAPIALGRQLVALHELVPDDALVWSEPDMTRVGRANVVAFRDLDGDDALTPTALDAVDLADEVVGWSPRDRAAYLESESATRPAYQVGFNIETIDGNGGVVLGGADAALRLEILSAEGAACWGLALPPRADDDALAAELEDLAPRQEGRFAAVEAPVRDCPGGEVPADWSEVYCFQDPAYVYYVELIAQPAYAPARCGPTVEYCTIRRDTPLPGAWCGGAP